ncbi:TPA: hypothetical protein NKB39_001778 [Vibrio parahaemolyticus]|nr:hypothetical protein [Vibrio parahaemolyticus]
MKYLVLMLFTIVCFKVSANNKIEALNHIAVFADSICGTMQHDGDSRNVEFGVEAKAGFNKLLKNLADLGISGTGKYKESDFSGVPHDDLSVTLKDERRCKEEMVKLLKDDLLVEEIKSCRLRAHGIEYYADSLEWSAESGYQKGGPSRGSYCESKRSERAQKYPDRVVTLISSNTSHKTKYNPLKQDYYNHYCSYRDDLNPVYRLRQSKECP